MPRRARLVIPGLPYHVTQRGNNRADVFQNDADRFCYLDLLQHYARKNSLSVLGYCLMSNHVHLVVIPGTEKSLARGVGQTHTRYSQLFNWKNERCGHLWQGRFYSCLLDEAHLVAAMRYVERNPVRAGIVENAWHYSWSSAATHLGDKNYLDLLDLQTWSKQWPPQEWQKMLSQLEPDEQLTEIRTKTKNGHPLASDIFISSIEAVFNCRLRRFPVGRPRKATNLDKH